MIAFLQKYMDISQGKSLNSHVDKSRSWYSNGQKGKKLKCHTGQLKHIPGGFSVLW